MCQKKPGPRCANHAKKDVLRAMEKVEAARTAGFPPEDSLRELTRAGLDYAGTPTGRAEYVNSEQYRRDPAGTGDMLTTADGLRRYRQQAAVAAKGSGSGSYAELLERDAMNRAELALELRRHYREYEDDPTAMEGLSWRIDEYSARLDESSRARDREASALRLAPVADDGGLTVCNNCGRYRVAEHHYCPYGQPTSDDEAHRLGKVRTLSEQHHVPHSDGSDIPAELRAAYRSGVAEQHRMMPYRHTADGAAITVSAEGRDNDLLHSYGDQPSRVTPDGSMEWHNLGKLHRDRQQPARIVGDRVEYWEHGVLVGTGTFHRSGAIVRD